MAAGIGSVFLTAMVGSALAGQQSTQGSSLKGVWSHIEISNAEGTIKPRPGMVIFTDGHFSVTREGGTTPRPEFPPQDQRTEADLREALRFVGQSGTYEVAGNELTLRYVVTSNANLMLRPSFTTFTYQVDGDNLTLINKANTNGPMANPSTYRYVRLE